MSDLLNEISIWGDYSDSGKPRLLNDGIYQKSKVKEEFLKKNFRLSRSVALNIRNKIRIIRNKVKQEKKNNKVRTTIQAGFTYLPLEELKNHYTKESLKFGESKIKKRISEMLLISKENDIEFINSIPFNFNLNDKITKKKPILNKYEVLLKEFFLMFDSRQIYEGGFFVMIGKKK